MNWQPIKTAPRDGTPFLAYVSVHKMVVIAEWRERDHVYDFRLVNDGRNLYERVLIPREMILQTHPVSDTSCISHWMPLPRAP